MNFSGMRLLKSFRNCCAAALFSAAAFCCMPAAAQVNARQYDFQIPAESLAAALTRFGITADQQVMFSPDLVKGRMAAPVSGRYTPVKALQLLLNGTGLTYEVTASNILLVKNAARQGASLSPAPIRTIEEVVVTAEKRSQNLQRVPVSLSAISGDSFDRKGIADMQDLSAHIPNLRFGSALNGGEYQIVIRGLFNPNTTSGGDSPITYSVDGVYYSRSNIVGPEYFDVERIEVLRGPQGTLQGRNSVGGSINVITNKPTDELSGHVDLLVGDYNARKFRTWFNVPLYDDGESQVLFRGTTVSARHAPYQKNLSTAPTATSDKADAEDYRLLRASLLFRLSANADFLLTGSTSNNTGPYANKVVGDFSAQPNYAGTPMPSDPRLVYKNSPEGMIQTIDTLSATLNLDWGTTKFTSISGYMKAYIDQPGDTDGSDLTLARVDFRRSGFRQWSEEVRLASDDENNPLQWIAGLFYFQEHVERGFYYSEPGNFIYDNGGEVMTRAIAPFGQIDFDLGKTSLDFPLIVTAGLRWNYDEKSGNDFQIYTTPGPVQTIQSGVRENSWSEWTGKFGLQYQANDDLMFYGSVSRGYVSGGYLLGTYAGPGKGGFYPETAWAYEAGMKSQFWDNRLQFNAAVFRSNIHDMQVFIQRGPISSLENAAKAHVTGIEAELVMLPIENLRLNLAGSLTDAVFDDFISDDNRTGQTNVDMSGNKLLQTPNYTFKLGAEYDFDFVGGTLTPRIDFFLSGEVWFIQANNPAYDRQAAYTRTDLNLTWRDARNRFTLEAFVKNLEDKDVISNLGIASRTMGGAPAPTPVLSYVSYYPPRTLGLRFGVNF